MRQALGRPPPGSAAPCSGPLSFAAYSAETGSVTRGVSCPFFHAALRCWATTSGASTGLREGEQRSADKKRQYCERATDPEDSGHYTLVRITGRVAISKPIRIPHIPGDQPKIDEPDGSQGCRGQD